MSGDQPKQRTDLPSGSRSHQNRVEAAEPSADIDTQPTSTLLFRPVAAEDSAAGGNGGRAARLDDEEHAAGGGVEREHAEVNRVLGQATAANPTPLLTALAIPGAASAHRLGADVVVGAQTGGVASLRGRVASR
jgi:hypothetical protein